MTASMCDCPLPVCASPPLDPAVPDKLCRTTLHRCSTMQYHFYRCSTIQYRAVPMQHHTVPWCTRLYPPLCWRLEAQLPACLNCLIACLPAHLPACLPAYLPAHLPACLPQTCPPPPHINSCAPVVLCAASAGTLRATAASHSCSTSSPAWCSTRARSMARCLTRPP